MSADRLLLDVVCKRGGFELAVCEPLELSGITAVFGRSGSGKTTLLRAIAGLDRPGGGHIQFGEETWYDRAAGVDVPVHKRGAGYMFQTPRLFSHLDVRGNLAFADRRSTKGANDISFDEAVSATGLSDLLDKRVETLSGGEAQRVALARTLLSRPKLLLLDEPLTGLDRPARRTLLAMIRDLPKRFALPVIHVTHDVEEITALADHIMILGDGRVKAHGRLVEVSRLMDLMPLSMAGGQGAIIEGLVRGHDGQAGLTRLGVGDETLWLPLNRSLSVGSLVRVNIHAGDVSIALQKPEQISIRNIVAAKIERITPDEQARSVTVELALGDQRLRSSLTPAAVADLALAPGREVYALIKSVRLAGELG
ncbi:molybdenum ABC transporter ATP-binding protein [Henriciella litoralis]|uniref:molybdenum ABC transporter ATP-binding protein n=1 Tax=Henriciella litoralis TaxID=568102 RepID=UPI001469DF0D|nr:molybdenum ABC transporter ATP-binding protein [Henriciella litoralis]